MIDPHIIARLKLRKYYALVYYFFVDLHDCINCYTCGNTTNNAFNF